MRAIIIDDEKHCREGLSILLSRYCPEVKIVDQCSEPRVAIQSIELHKPDIIFLDIEMPGMNGFELLESFDTCDFEIIFTTAYNEYAIKAIRHSALDYLLKPVNKNELIQAVQRAREVKNVTASVRVSELLKMMEITKVSQRIAIPTAEGLLIVDTREILFCESENNYTRFYLLGGRKIFVSKTLKKVEELLVNNTSFFRIHNSFLINLEFVQQYVKGDGGEVIMSNGSSLPVSRIKKTEFLDLLERL